MDDEIADILTKCRSIAAEPQSGRAVKPPLVSPVAASIDEAWAMSRRLNRPVQTDHNGHPVTVWPIGMRPDMD